MVIHYKEYGNKEGPLLLFLHGGGAGGWMWDKQVDYFTNYHCLIPTLQGHGERSAESTFSIKGNAQEMIELLEGKKKGREINIIGFSIGAQITLEILSLAPTLIHSAVINSALIMPIKVAKPLIAPSIKLTSPLIKNRTFSKIQAKQLYIDDRTFEKYYEDSLKMSVSTLIEVLQENMAYELPKSFSKTTARILVTVGEKEKAVMRKSAIKIAKSHSTSSCIVIPKVGHGFSLAQPEQFNELVEKWLNESTLTSRHM